MYNFICLLKLCKFYVGMLFLGVFLVSLIVFVNVGLFVILGWFLVVMVVVGIVGV